MTNLSTIGIKITGIRPLVMNNGAKADRLNETMAEIKKITAKGSKKMTTADHDERDRLEWLAGLYWSDALGGIAIPSDNIERCVQEGAKKSRLGKDFAAAVLMTETEAEVMHPMRGKPRTELYANPGYTMRKGVKVQLARIIRIRPMVPSKWTIVFHLEFDVTIINQQQVIDAVVNAGALVGLGDWRPKFGRFTVEVLS